MKSPTSSHQETAAFQEELNYFCPELPTVASDKVDYTEIEMSPTLTIPLFTFLRYDDVSVHLTDKTYRLNIK